MLLNLWNAMRATTALKGLIYQKPALLVHGLINQGLLLKVNATTVQVCIDE